MGCWTYGLREGLVERGRAVTCHNLRASTGSATPAKMVPAEAVEEL